MTSAPATPSAPVDPFEGQSLALALTAGGSFLTIALAIARSKVSATVLGPNGLGIISEVTQVAAMMIVPLAILSGPALTRALATTDDEAGARKALQTALRLALWSGLIIPIAAGLGALVTFHGLDRFEDRLWWTVVSGVIAWAGGFIAVISAALVATRRPIRAAVFGLVQNMVLAVGSVVGTVVAGISGQLIGVAVASAISIPLALRALWSVLGPLRVPRLAIDWPWLRLALSVGAAALVSAFLAQALASVLRWLAFRHGGSDANGQLQAVMAVSSTYFGVVLTSLGAIAFPAFAAARDKVELEGAVKATVNRVLRLAPPIILLGFALRVPVMRVLYSSQFESASEVLGVQMAGDLPKAVAWALGGPLLLRAKVRAFIISDVLANVALAGSALVCVPLFGMTGFGVAYVLGYSLALLSNAMLLRKVCDVTVPPLLIISAIAGGLLLTVVGHFRWTPWAEVIAGVVGVVWAIRVGAIGMVRALVHKVIDRLRRLRASRNVA